MTPTVPVRKDEEAEQLVPSVWRSTLRQIVSAFVGRDYGLACSIVGVEPVDKATQSQITDYVKDYGETLVELPAETWESSVAQWTGQDWDLLVDLWTENEGPSDLVLHARVFESEEGYGFKVHLVYVP